MIGRADAFETMCYRIFRTASWTERKTNNSVSSMAGSRLMLRCDVAEGKEGNLYTVMDITCLYTSSGSLFVRDSGCSRHVGRNYVPLFVGVDTHNRMLTYVIT